MAAAASTLLNQLQYGDHDSPDRSGHDSPDRLEASNGKKASHHSSTLDLCASSSSDKDMDYKPDGLVFSDDEDYLLDIDDDLEEEQLRLSFPKNKKRMNIIPVVLNPLISPCTPNLNNKRCWMRTLLRGSRSQTGIAINM